MTSNLKQQTASEIKYYAPSYLDRFMGFIERLPIPYWLTYLALFTVQSLIMHIFAWVDGWLQAYTFNPILFLFPLWQWVPLAIITYSDSVSLQALYTFSPLLDVEEIDLEKLKIRIHNHAFPRCDPDRLRLGNRLCYLDVYKF